MAEASESAGTAVEAVGEHAGDAAAEAAAHGGEKHGLLDQFKIDRFVDIDLGFDASFSNSSAMMVATVALISIFMIFGLGRRRMIPGRMQGMVEATYEMVARMLGDTVGGKGAERAFPLVFSLFMFLLFGNLLGLIPYAFTFTSHIVVTFMFAAVIFIGVTLLGLIIHRHHFFSYFAPSGVPIFLMPVLVPIEIISYIARPISLSVRLFANMMAGHTILHVFGTFIAALAFFGFLPFGFMVALYGLEILGACLQAYVFAILTCLYIRDAIHLH